MARGRNPRIWRHVRANRRQRRSDITLTPIMNLFIVLIPFLLFSATFVEFTAVRGVLAEIGAPADPPSLRAGVVVEIDDAGFRLTSRTVQLGRLVDNGSVHPGRGQVVVEGHDFVRLGALLTQIKEKFPDERSLRLSPKPQVPYQLVVSTIDVIRYRQANGATKREELFPDVAFMKYGVRGK